MYSVSCVDCWHDNCRCKECSVCGCVPLSCPVCPVDEVMQNCYKKMKMPEIRKCSNWAKPEPKKYTWHQYWLRHNSNLVSMFASCLQTSTESIQYFLLQMMFSNFGKMFNLNGPLGMCYFIPMAGYHDENQLNIFDCWGFLRDPFDPSNVVEVLEAIKFYVIDKIYEIQDINLRFEMLLDGLLLFLGCKDPLVELLQKINTNIDFGINIDKFLEILVNGDPSIWCKCPVTQKRKQSQNLIKDIEELYTKIAYSSRQVNVCKSKLSPEMLEFNRLFSETLNCQYEEIKKPSRRMFKSQTCKLKTRKCLEKIPNKKERNLYKCKTVPFKDESNFNNKNLKSCRGSSLSNRRTPSLSNRRTSSLLNKRTSSLLVCCDAMKPKEKKVQFACPVKKVNDQQKSNSCNQKKKDGSTSFEP